MGTYAVTGSASGMGRSVVAKLAALGHTVITVDIKDADRPPMQSYRRARDPSTAPCWPPVWGRPREPNA
jgi:NAD(P)-dependent dehydrogenase (short-subunit alcohol dehydrogenase family)